MVDGVTEASAGNSHVIAIDGVAYTWTEWPTADPRSEWSHHGLAVLADASVATFSQATRELVLSDPDGVECARHPVPAVLAHGITAARWRGAPALWIADIGALRQVVDGRVETRISAPQVIAVDLGGRPLATLDRPPEQLYAGGSYMPTGVAVDDGPQGTGEIWVADGYGQSLVHRYTADGSYRSTIDGTLGAGQFDCPHSVFVDRRATDPVVHVADRGNRRIQVFDLDGAFVRSYGSSFLRAPSAFAPIGDKLLVGDLHARLTLVDADDRLVAHVGDGGDSHAEPGWPNAIVAADAIVARRSTPGAFGSPHGLATMSDGTIIVAEWRLGGRIVALRPVSGTQPARRHPAARPGAGRSAP